MEEDGEGFSEGDIREALLSTNGVWWLQLEGRTAAGMKVLAEGFGLTAREIAVRTTSDLSRAYSGTRTEVEWLGGKLTEGGVGWRIAEAR